MRRRRSWIVSGYAIDDGQAGLSRGAVAGIDPPVDRRRKHHASAFLQANKAVAPSWIVGAKVRARNGNQPAALGEPRQRRRNMTQGGVGDTAVDVSRS